MTERNYFFRFIIILLLSAIVGIGLYPVPQTIFGVQFKKVDLLSEIRIPATKVPLDSLITDTEIDSLLITRTSEINDSTSVRGLHSPQLLQRDSLYQKNREVTLVSAEPIQVRIEDFSVGHTGLKHFFEMLNKIPTLNRPVRIAFLGDSFIEGDIMLADFRALMQARFGGEGVGFVPVYSPVEQFRPTITQRSKGWKSYSILSDKNRKYTLPGLMFEVENEEATITFSTVKTYPRLSKVSSLKFLYSMNEEAEMVLICNKEKDTITQPLPTTQTISQYEIKGNFTDGVFSFINAKGLQALGVAFEANTGVVVDNLSLRGSSGMPISDLDLQSCIAFRKVRPYDLIVLQFGLNVVSQETLEYGWYCRRMVRAIEHLQLCFPEADILLLSVSDRSYYQDGSYNTMPAVVSLVRSQHQTAQLAQIPYWSVFDAMGGEEGMVRYVDRQWASKDYTHLSFRGGKELATLLFNALILEKEIYDEMDRVGM